MKRFKYMAKHIEFLRTGYKIMNIRDLTKAFNKRFKIKKTEVAIKSVIENNKIRCGRSQKERLITRFRLFTSEQIQFLRDNYNGRSIVEMKDLFNATFNINMTWQQIKTAVHNRGITSGRSGRYKKGNVPWTKGTKGLCKPNTGNFKKGSVPKNIRAINEERICPKDGYVSIKVGMHNPYTGFYGYWRHKHVYMWEQEHGSVPDGFVVAFRDGDKLNIDPENLMLISRAELFRLNQYGYKDAPAELKPSILALAQLEVKVFSAEKEK